MSIRHVVMWRLAGDASSAKAANAQLVKDALLPLVGKLPEIVSMTLHDNIVDEARNADLILISEFATLEDLQAYQVHPDHVAAAAVIREATTDRVVGDWEQ